MLSGGESLEDNFGAIRGSASVAFHSSFPAEVDGRRRCLKFCLLESMMTELLRAQKEECAPQIVILYEDKLCQSLAKIRQLT